MRYASLAYIQNSLFPIRTSDGLLSPIGHNVGLFYKKKVNKMDIFEKQRKENILELFKKDKYVSREKLNDYFDTDTQMRDYLAKLADEDIFILNFQDGKGYFMGNEEEKLRYAKQETRRALSCLHRARQIKKSINTFHLQQAYEELKKFCEG